MRVIKSAYRGNNNHHLSIEEAVGSLIGDLESFSSEVLHGLHFPGSSAQLRIALQNAMGSLRDCEFDLYERLISFGKTLRVLVDSTSSMNKKCSKRIEVPIRSLVQTYFRIAYQTKHKDITETAEGLTKDLSNDPNQVSFVRGY